MKGPKLWKLESGNYTFRVRFDFVDEQGALLQTKTWEVHREKSNPPQVLFLQAVAQVGEAKPRWNDLGPNYVQITTPVKTLAGKLTALNFTGFMDQERIKEVLASSPLTVGIVVDDAGLHITMHVARIGTDEPL